MRRTWVGALGGLLCAASMGTAYAGSDDFVELRAGFWYATLQRPNLFSDEILALSPTLFPDRDVGEGKGLMRQVGFDVQVLRNRLAFDYLTDQLLGDDTAGTGKLGRESLRLITGELLPYVGSDNVRPFIEVTSGKFEGGLRDPRSFIRHDGKSYTPRGDHGWTSDLLVFDLGLRYELTGARAGGFGGFGFGYRHTRFGIPTVVLDSDLLTVRQKYLVDTEVTFDDGYLTFFAGWAPIVRGAMVLGFGKGQADLGKWGQMPGASFNNEMSLDLRLPLVRERFVQVAVYAGFLFRMNMLLAIRPKGFSEPGAPPVSTDPGAFSIQKPFSQIIYFMWGPTFGAEVRF